MDLVAHARIVMWEGASLWLVDATPNLSPEPRRTDFHAHHAIQVTISLGGWFRLDTAAASVSEGAAAVAADATHIFEAEGLMALLFIEPESRDGRAVSAGLFDGRDLAAVAHEVVGDFSAAAAALFRAPVRDDASLIRLGRALVARITGGGEAETPDPRVRRMMAWAGGQIDGAVSLADYASTSRLSPGRLSHLFVEQTGLPFRTYLLWLRLTRAVGAVASGAPLTEAAHEAGFSDSAHFSRTFRRMFGVAPASLRIT